VRANRLNNPVLSSSFKIRMRGWKTSLGIVFYLGIMVLIAYLYYITFLGTRSAYQMSVNSRQEIGAGIYTILAVLQFGLIVLITPAQTAGTISGEREKQTLDLLLSTSLSPMGIILGKLLSSMSYIVLLVLSSIPLFSMISFFGGITPGDIITLFTFYLVTAFAIGNIGIYYSTTFKKTVTATVMTYVTIFALGLISFILGLFMASNHYLNNPNPSGDYIPFVLYINPVIGLAQILESQLNGSVGSIIGMGSSRLRYFWIYNSIVMLAIALILFLLSVIKINPVFRLKSRRNKISQEA
jgi:ABC-2 type transport system permease protein